MTAIASYEDLITVMRARRLDIGMSLLELDDRVGWASGYAGKVEAWRRNAGQRANGARINIRTLSWTTVFEACQALGMRVEIVIDPDARPPASINPPESRKYAILEPHLSAWRRRKLLETQKSRASAGGKAVAAKLGRHGRRARAKRAAKARWRKKAEDAASPRGALMPLPAPAN